VKSKQKIVFELENFGPVISLPDVYSPYFELLCQKHGLFKTIFSSKKLAVNLKNACNHILQTKTHYLEKISPELWILVTLWGVTYEGHWRK